MTDFLVTRHAATRAWLATRGFDGVGLDHLDAAALARLGPGDRVIGTLPVPLAGRVCATGARYFHLCLDITAADRGRELSAPDLDRLGARLLECIVHLPDTEECAP